MCTEATYIMMFCSDAAPVLPAPVLPALICTITATRYLGPDYGAPTADQEAITAAAVGQLAPHSFPLCMLNLYNHVHTDHHLRHHGRQQFGLFLKVRVTHAC